MKNKGLSDQFWSIEEVLKTVRSDGAELICLETGKTIDAFLLYSISFDESELYYVYVSKEARGQGLSKKLMQMYLDQLISKSIHRVFLEVRESNVVAQNLYKAYGIKILAKEKSIIKMAKQPSFMKRYCSG